MRKLFILLLGIVFYSCSENDRLIYSEGMHDIYYSDVTKDKDSIFVSLLTAERELTTTINVKLLGDTLRVSEKFKLEVIPGKTTAKEGVHYQKLPETYEFPTGVFEYKMPVTLIKGDEGITKAPVILALRLVPVAGLGIAYENRSVVRLIISDMLRKPGQGGDGHHGGDLRPPPQGLRQQLGPVTDKLPPLPAISAGGIQSADVAHQRILAAGDMFHAAHRSWRVLVFSLRPSVTTTSPGEIT